MMRADLGFSNSLRHARADVGPNEPDASARGFTLIEAVIAMAIMTVALLALAQVLYAGLNIAATSSPNLIAREKAREAIESVHTARDTHTIVWSEIRNVAAPDNCPAGTTASGGGVFENNLQDMLAPGPDGLVNTADDDDVEVIPGPDNRFGTDDDVPLVGYQRRIDICDMDGNPDLRQITVTISYQGSNAFGLKTRTYRLVTLISRFS
jgi:prepilin-type N-terminal cleavage/methylation domain-containing protein